MVGWLSGRSGTGRSGRTTGWNGRVVIEQAMIFTLGFLVAGFLTLLFLPAYGRRATRLAQRRLEMLMPLSMEEIVAERDQLRAEFAAAHRRVEQRAEAVEARHAVVLGELGRREARIASLEFDLADAKRTATEAQIRLETAHREALEAQAERAAIAKEAFDAQGLMDRRGEELVGLRLRHGETERLANERAMTVAALEARVAELEAEVSTGQARLKRELETVASQKETLEAALETAREEHRALRLQLAAREEATRGAAAPLGLEETAMLRRAISDIGADVVRLAAALEKEEPATGGAMLAERVRELQASAARLG